MSDMINELRLQLTEYAPDQSDAKAAQSRLEILEGLDALAEPFVEQADLRHVTASAVVVSTSGVLLHKHKRFDIWVGPGGHIDEGESAPEAAVRETLEETGLLARHFDGAPTLIHVDVHAGPKGHTHLDTRWLLQTEPSTPRPPAGESPEVYRLSFEEAMSRVPEDFLGALKRAQQILAAR